MANITSYVRFTVGTKPIHLPQLNMNFRYRNKCVPKSLFILDLPSDSIWLAIQQDHNAFLVCPESLKYFLYSAGNYDEGFGRETHKTKWIDKSGAPASSSNPSASEAADNTEPTTSTEAATEDQE